MGRKYASLHVKAADVDRERLLQTYKGLTKPMAPMGVAHVAQRLGLPLDEREVPLLDAILEKFDTTGGIRVKEHCGYISIYDQQLSFERVADAALGLSAALRAEVLFASVYDDDVFFFGLYQNGLCVAEHVSGQCEAYGMEKTNKNIALMEKYLGIDPDTEFTLLNQEGVEFETALQKCLGFSLSE